jgi:carboxyl-terminal processing protease
LFGEVFERVRAQYVDPVTDQQLIEHAVKGMLTNLDPHSDFMTAKEFDEMRVQTKGEFGGLGIEVTMEDGVVKVVSPIDDTPAAKAGIKPGDLITHLDRKPVQGMSLSEAVDTMRGKVGTTIELAVRREGKDAPMFIKVKRDIIRIQSVRSRLEGEDIGYIRITTFSDNTEEGLKKAFETIKKDAGSKLSGYILDLRNNPGGLLDQAIAVSDAFLDRGEIVSTRGRSEDDIKRDNATSGDLAEGLPVVVLINGGSASASEIVSGALQDHRRAVLMGTKSFGKGSVQTVIPLPGQGAMRLTTARYFTPSGRSIQAKGIEPDILVEPAKVEKIDDERIHESDLKGAISNPDGEDAKKPEPAKIEEEKPDPKEKDDKSSKNETRQEREAKAAEQDYQLARARDLLHGLILIKKQKE